MFAAVYGGRNATICKIFMTLRRITPFSLSAKKVPDCAHSALAE